MPENLHALVRTLRYEAIDIISVELIPVSGVRFPPFTAGAHIDLHLPNGTVRSYSLINSQHDRDRYVIAVLNEQQGGGSTYIHEHLRCGAQIHLSAPRNRFALDESAASSVLIAGGIGITAILSMARRLVEIKRGVKVLYAARSRGNAAFVDALLAIGCDVQCHFSNEHNGERVDIRHWLSMQPAETHAYCCGPNAMIDTFEAACVLASIRNVHLERFHPIGTIANAAGGSADLGANRDATESYLVELQRSGRTVNVVAGDSLLDTLLDAGIDVDYSCREGLCGACEVEVMAGAAVHRDSILTQSQRESNRVIYVCVSHGRCSQSREDRLVLNL